MDMLINRSINDDNRILYVFFQYISFFVKEEMVRS